MRVLRSRDLLRRPWKNGGGSTTQIAIHPPEADFSVDPFFWRVSSARIEQAGPFSRFPGYERLLTLLEGDSLDLRIGRREHRLRDDRVARFSGNWEAGCGAPVGNVLDLGVIYDPKRVRAELRHVKRPDATYRCLAATTFLYCVQGELDVQGEVLRPHDVLRVDGVADLSLRASFGTHYALMTLELTKS